MKNKYEKIFTKEDEDGAEINYPYELKKANIVISNLIEQRNIALDKLAMIRAEAIMLNDELMELKEKYKETETEEEIKKENEEEEPNAEE
jgi:cell division protein ZapA (FtsZ GTPase activity inhibitor)